MLITTPATVLADYALIEDRAVVSLTAVPAAQRALADSGAGAFACGSAPAASPISRAAAAPALPRIRRASGTDGLGTNGLGGGQHGAVAGGVGRHSAAVSGVGQQSAAVSTKPNQMTRNYPAALGAVGPYPAREPDPV